MPTYICLVFIYKMELATDKIMSPQTRNIDPHEYKWFHSSWKTKFLFKERQLNFRDLQLLEYTQEVSSSHEKDLS